MIKKNTNRVVVVDHFDSFTHNMVALLTLSGAEVHVVRTDASIGEVRKFRPTHIVLSAGAGHPKDVRLFHEVLEWLKGRLPILGICLGYQVIGLHFGATIMRCAKIMHGKTSVIYHARKGVFSGIDGRFQGMRYHSLAIVKKNFPAELRQTARTSDGTVMGIQSVRYPSVVGVQFHPESLFTEHGAEMFRNFLSMR